MVAKLWQGELKYFTLNSAAEFRLPAWLEQIKQSTRRQKSSQQASHRKICKQRTKVLILVDPSAPEGKNLKVVSN